MDGGSSMLLQSLHSLCLLVRSERVNCRLRQEVWPGKAGAWRPGLTWEPSDGGYSEFHASSSFPSDTCATGWIVSPPSVPTCLPGVAQISINHRNITMLWIVLLMSINKEWLTFTDIWFYLKHMIDGKQSILSPLYKFKNWNLGPPINLLKLLKFYVKANVENKTQDFWHPCQCSGTLLAPAAFHQMYPWEARSISTPIEKGTGAGAPCPVVTGPAWEVKGEVNFQIKSLLESCKMWASY